MKKKSYNSLKEIQSELQVLQLQRDIQLEELKLTRHQLKDDLSPANWITTPSVHNFSTTTRSLSPINLPRKLICFQL